MKKPASSLIQSEDVFLQHIIQFHQLLCKKPGQDIPLRLLLLWIDYWAMTCCSAFSNASIPVLFVFETG